jgi:hypothetical protein
VYVTHAVDVDFVAVEVVVTSAVVVIVRVARCDTTTVDTRLIKRRTITTFILKQSNVSVRLPSAHRFLYFRT